MKNKEIKIEIAPHDTSFVGKNLSYVLAEIVKLRLGKYNEKEQIYIYQKILHKNR
ncbi:hypothetical protein [Garciella nitratireducens]|uniref:hypothetical protein n=1 Tax=Garciella nitratireducens TaxID=218205 RepID=UPI001BD2C986|nr:hypothetical protein [Garciella nitratireducens]